MEAFVEVQKKEIESQQAATGESDVLLSAAIKTLTVSSTDTSMEKQNEQGSLIPSHVASKDFYETHVKDENKGIVLREYTSPKETIRYDERAPGTANRVQKEESPAQLEPSLTPQWIWSDSHQNYYYATYDSYGKSPTLVSQSLEND
jgi:hypothetical protein